MRFLITANQKYMVPPEVQIGLLDGSVSWAKKYTANKKIEQSWSFVGLPGGCGILNVSSLEELNQIVAEFPLGAITQTEIRPIMDFEEGINQAKKAIMSMVKS